MPFCLDCFLSGMKLYIVYFHLMIGAVPYQNMLTSFQFSIWCHNKGIHECILNFGNFGPFFFLSFFFFAFLLFCLDSFLSGMKPHIVYFHLITGVVPYQNIKLIFLTSFQFSIWCHIAICPLFICYLFHLDWATKAIAKKNWRLKS